MVGALVVLLVYDEGSGRCGTPPRQGSVGRRISQGRSAVSVGALGTKVGYQSKDGNGEHRSQSDPTDDQLGQ